MAGSSAHNTALPVGLTDGRSRHERALWGSPMELPRCKRVFSILIRVFLRICAAVGLLSGNWLKLYVSH